MRQTNLPISVLLLTLNEEANLPSCLRALSWCDDVVVLDSFSKDNTVEVAKSAGCRVFQRKFDSFAGQRNFGLEEIDLKHEWVLHIDADEVATPELVEEISRKLRNTPTDAFRIAGKMIFQGRWLRHAGMYPAYQVRLTRRGAFRFIQVGHGQKEGIEQARIGTLKEGYLHHSFSKGIRDWFERHARYAEQDAALARALLEKGRPDWQGLFSSDGYRRRLAIRSLSAWMPFRPFLRFAYMFFARKGFLDGMAGFHYCCLLAIYEYMIVLNLKQEMRFADKVDLVDWWGR